MKPETRTGWRVGVSWEAECMDCGWQYGPEHEASVRAESESHALTTGHEEVQESRVQTRRVMTRVLRLHR